VSINENPHFSIPKANARMTVVSLVCLVLFAGCSFAPKYAEPSVQTPAAFKEMTPAQSSVKLTAGKPPSQSDDVASRPMVGNVSRAGVERF
jgi:uncharacterized lipoprotein YajG